MTFVRTLLIALLPLLATVAAAREVPVAMAVPPAEKDRTDLATLVVPITMDIDSVDGIAYRGLQPWGRKGDLTVRVLPGEREVQVQYSQLYQITADEHEIVRSKKMVLSFLAEPGKTYRMVHANFRNVEEARAGVENFVVRIEDEGGQNRIVAATQATTDWKGETTTNQRKDLANATLAATVAPKNPAALQGLDALKDAWQHASADDRSVFLEWVKGNP